MAELSQYVRTTLSLRSRCKSVSSPNKAVSVSACVELLMSQPDVVALMAVATNGRREYESIATNAPPAAGSSLAQRWWGWSLDWTVNLWTLRSISLSNRAPHVQVNCSGGGLPSSVVFGCQVGDDCALLSGVVDGKCLMEQVVLDVVRELVVKQVHADDVGCACGWLWPVICGAVGGVVVSGVCWLA